MFWFYKLAGLAGLENSSEETWLISDVPEDLLDIVDRDYSMICRQKKMFKHDPIRDRQPMKLY